MESIPEPIRGKLIGGGYDSLDKLPNNENVDRWNRVQTRCALTDPELDQLMNIRFPVQQASMTSGAGPSDIAEQVATAVVNAMKPLLGKRFHRTSASGSATGVNTPPPASSHNELVPVGGGRSLPRVQFDEAKRYFDLFHDALADRYPHGGYSIMYNETNGMCTTLGRRTGDVYKFMFEPDTIKNHYCSFRLLNDFENYLALARSQSGVQDYARAGLITPPYAGPVHVAYRK